MSSTGALAGPLVDPAYLAAATVCRGRLQSTFARSTCLEAGRDTAGGPSLSVPSSGRSGSASATHRAAYLARGLGSTYTRRRPRLGWGRLRLLVDFLLHQCRGSQTSRLGFLVNEQIVDDRIDRRPSRFVQHLRQLQVPEVRHRHLHRSPINFGQRHRS